MTQKTNPSLAPGRVTRWSRASLQARAAGCWWLSSRSRMPGYRPGSSSEARLSAPACGRFCIDLQGHLHHLLPSHWVCAHRNQAIRHPERPRLLVPAKQHTVPDCRVRSLRPRNIRADRRGGRDVDLYFHECPLGDVGWWNIQCSHAGRSPSLAGSFYEVCKAA